MKALLITVLLVVLFGIGYWAWQSVSEKPQATDTVKNGTTSLDQPDICRYDSNTIEQFVSESDVVIHGVVGEVTTGSAVDGETEKSYEQATVSIDEVMKGTITGDVLTVRRYEAPSTPVIEELTSGEEVILFLVNGPEGQTFYDFIGGSVGKFARYESRDRGVLMLSQSAQMVLQRDEERVGTALPTETTFDIYLRALGDPLPYPLEYTTFIADVRSFARGGTTSAAHEPITCLVADEFPGNITPFQAFDASDLIVHGRVVESLDELVSTSGVTLASFGGETARRVRIDIVEILKGSETRSSIVISAPEPNTELSFRSGQIVFTVGEEAVFVLTDDDSKEGEYIIHAHYGKLDRFTREPWGDRMVGLPAVENWGKTYYQQVHNELLRGDQTPTFSDALNAIRDRYKD